MSATTNYYLDHKKEIEETLNGKKRICANHLFSYWGNDQFGKPYPHCNQGNKLNQPCEELKEEENGQ